MTSESDEEFMERMLKARAAFVAMVTAWPGMDFAEGVYCGKPYNDLILPLTENTDAEA